MLILSVTIPVQKISAYADFNDKNLDYVLFVGVNNLRDVREHLTTKLYVDNARSNSVDESLMLRSGSDKKLKFDETDSTFFISTLTSSKNIKKHLPRFLLIPYLKTIQIDVIYV